MLSWRTPILWGCLTTCGAFLLRAVPVFLEGESLDLRDRSNLIGPLISGLLVGLLVKFDYLIPHPNLVVTILAFASLAIVAITRHRSDSL